MFKYKLLLSLLLLYPFFPVVAQNNANFQFKKIQVNDGLSENAVFSILQDSKGFIWMGTKDGLNKYDGIDFRVFRKDANDPNSLGNNFVRSIREANNGQLYLGTDAGLYIMNPANEMFTKLGAKTKENVSVKGAINSLYFDNKSNVWIGTMSDGVFVFNTATGELKNMKFNGGSLGQNAVWCIYGDTSNNIWIGTRLGLAKYNPTTDMLDPINGLFSFVDSSKHEVLSIYEDNDGILWFGTWATGLFSYNNKSGIYDSYLGENNRQLYVTHIRSLSLYDTKHLLIGSDDGLYLFNRYSKASQRIDIPLAKSSLSDQNVYSIMKDREGGFWIGTYFGGVNYLSPSTFHVETYYPNSIPGTLSGKAVSQFCEDNKNNLWIATEDGGLNYLDTKTQKITQPIHTSYHNLHSLLIDGDNLWIGTYSRGIDVYNTKTGWLTNYKYVENNNQTINDDCIYSLYKAYNGDIYVGTPVGLNKFNRETNNFTRIKEVSGFIYDIKEDESHNLWLANYNGGAIKKDAHSGQWINYSRILEKNNPMVRGKLTSIFVDQQKRLVFTSEGQGIFVYNSKTDNFQNISEADGLPNGVTYGILEDSQNNWWISSNKGLICFNLSSPGEYKLYNKEEGFQSNQFNYKASYKTKNGQFYFGGVNGFSCFDPEEILKNHNNVIPQVELTQLNLLGEQDQEFKASIQQKINNKEDIILPYNKASFTISFVSLSYITQKKNQYAYKLVGADNKWSYVANNKNVTYVNLSPGKYKFRVKASNNDGVWNDVGTEIAIEILPPMWLSTPAKMIYVLLLCVIVYLGITYYIKRERQRQSRQLEKFKIEQETLSFKSKMDFFIAIAHEIRTPLSLIKAPLEEVIDLNEGGDVTKKNLALIDKNCERLTFLINQILDFRKISSSKYILNPVKFDIYKSLEEIFNQFKKTAEYKNIDLSLVLPGNKNLLVNTDPELLTKIVSNLLTNALKYAKTKIVLSVHINNDNTYSISVEDDGRGISDVHKKMIFDPFFQVESHDNSIGTGLGLALVKNLVEVMKGDITISDALNGGTIFTIEFSNMIHPISEDETSQPLDVDGTDLLVKRSGTNNRNTILVVDDNVELASFLQQSLQNDYAIVDVAHSGEEGLELLKKNNYDIIISDIMMPGIDGITFTKMIKADINYNHIPIVLLSAKTENAIKVEGLTSGADVFIEKPFSISFLKAQLSSLLENRKSLMEAFNRSPLASYSNLAVNKSEEQFLNNLNDEIEKHLSEEDFTVESLTEILNISRSNLQRKLKSISGVTPGDYLRNFRLKRACMLLLETDMRINEVAFAVGFSSPSYFTKAFQKAYDMLPKDFVAKYIKKDGD